MICIQKRIQYNLFNTIQYISINDFMYNMYDVNIQQCKEFYKINQAEKGYGVSIIMYILLNNDHLYV